MLASLQLYDYEEKIAEVRKPVAEKHDLHTASDHTPLNPDPSIAGVIMTDEVV